MDLFYILSYRCIVSIAYTIVVIFFAYKDLTHIKKSDNINKDVSCSLNLMDTTRYTREPPITLPIT